MGASVGDYNNDGWPDLLVTCFGGVVLYRNNGDGTFTDVTRSAGLGADCVEKPMRDEHRAELFARLDAAGLAGEVDVADFRRYGSARALYQFHVDHAAAY